MTLDNYDDDDVNGHIEVNLPVRCCTKNCSVFQGTWRYRGEH